MSQKQRMLTGLFVAGGFLLFALGLFWIGDRRLLFAESLELETRFARLGGLKAGSKVMVSGMDAGEVLWIAVPERPDGKFRVRFRVLARFRPMLRTDSVATIQVEGLVGSKVLQVEAGTPQGAPVAAGSVLPSREPVEVAAVIQQVADVVVRVNGAVDGVQQRVVNAVDVMAGVGEETQKLIANVNNEAQQVLVASRRVVNEVDSILESVQRGEGVAGKLLKDDRLYYRMEEIAQQLEATVANVRNMSDDLKRITGDIESRRLGATFEKTAGNVEQATARLVDVLAAIRPPGQDEQGLLDQLRETLDGAREAVTDLAENMEALKRNWFFRGYFNRRGFFDLDAVSLEDYRRGRLAPGRDRRRAWVAADELFALDKTGREIIVEGGVKRLGEELAPYLAQAPNTLLIIEGYWGHGDETEQYLRSRDRARLVRRVLIDRFGLKSNYVGVMPLGAGLPPEAPPQFRDGIALAFFTEKTR